MSMDRQKPPQSVFGLREILFFAAAIVAICLVAALVRFCRCYAPPFGHRLEHARPLTDDRKPQARILPETRLGPKRRLCTQQNRAASRCEKHASCHRECAGPVSIPAKMAGVEEGE